MNLKTLIPACAILLSGHIISYAQNNALYVAPSGNVGIGTLTPNYRLTLSSDSNALGVDNKAIFYARNVQGKYVPFMWPRWNDNRMYISYGNVGLIIRNQDEESAIVIDANRRVGIGGNPQSALDVKGRIRDSTGYVMPVGSIIAYGGTRPPDGWLLCDGQSCTRYVDLQKVVGNRVPDLRGRFIVGTGTNKNGQLTTYEQNDTGGQEKVILTEGEMPKHSHDVLGNTGTNGSGEFADKGRYNVMQGDRTPANYNNTTPDKRPYIGYSGQSKPHENRPPYYALTYIIKY